MILDLTGEVYWTDDLCNSITNADEDIVLNINSPGGAVFDGLNVVHAIQNSKHKVTAKINVMACSIAGVIALACDAVEITKNDILMLHNCWTYTQGNKEELENEVEAMKAIDTVLHNIIKEHCTLEDISERMNKGDVWITGEEAQDAFDHVTLVDVPVKEQKAASASLANLILTARTKVVEPKKEPEAEYKVSPEVSALLARAEEVLR